MATEQCWDDLMQLSSSLLSPSQQKVAHKCLHTLHQNAALMPSGNYGSVTCYCYDSRGSSCRCCQ